VVYVLDNPNRFKSAYFSGLVLGGDWDREGTLFADLWPAKCVRSRIREGKSWEETGAYEKMMENLTVWGKADGCRNLADVIARYERLDSLIQRLNQGGEFLSWRQLKATNIRERGGVFVHIGRNGQLFHSEKGNHRLAIAQELGLNWMPAQVGVVHRQAVENGLFQRLTLKPAACQC